MIIRSNIFFRERAEPPGPQYAGVAFSSAVRGGVEYTHTIGYPKMQVSTLHHGLWPFFTGDPHFTKLIFHPMHFIKEVPH